MIILDTNVISALMGPGRNAVVAAWLDSQPSLSIWTTSINILEVRYGIAQLARGRRRATGSRTRSTEFFASALGGRILGFGEAEAEAGEAAMLMAKRRAAGRRVGGNDDMIAGIVRVKRATLATRNVRHFEDAGIALVDPWGA